MRRFLVFLLAGLALAGPAMADQRAACRADGGQYVTGMILRGPRFVPGHYRDGLELSHTRLMLRAADGNRYDVRIDNLFAAGYGQGDSVGDSVPAPLSALHPGERLALCGRIYTTRHGFGMDWVHTNCGAPATSRRPDGWVKPVDAEGVAGPNLAGSERYCSLFR